MTPAPSHRGPVLFNWRSGPPLMSAIDWPHNPRSKNKQLGQPPPHPLWTSKGSLRKKKQTISPISRKRPQSVLLAPKLCWVHFKRKCLTGQQSGFYFVSFGFVLHTLVTPHTCCSCVRDYLSIREDPTWVFSWMVFVSFSLWPRFQ